MADQDSNNPMNSTPPPAQPTGPGSTRSLDDVAPPTDQFDPAQQSLADALQVSFNLLKLILLALVVIYLFSGIFTVDEQQRAVKLRFGKIVSAGPEGEQVLDQGLYFALPFPIHQVLYVPMAPRTLNLDDQFWFEQAGNAPPGEIKQGPLVPGRDGSMITGDANIVHVRWAVTYSVSDPVAYVQNVGEEERAVNIVRNASEQGLVYAVSLMEADQVIKGQLNTVIESEGKTVRQIAVDEIQASLDAMEAGLKIDQLSVSNTAMPGSVRQAYQAVTSAESEKARLIDQAQQERSRILGETAGEAHDELWQLVQAYELALSRDEQEQADQHWEDLATALAELSVTDAEGREYLIGGRASEIINEAKTYRAQVVERVRADAETFKQLLPLWRDNPQIVESRIWLTAKEEIMTGDVETLYMPEGQLYLELNRDPEVSRRIEEKRLQQQQEEARQRSRDMARNQR